MRKRTVLVPLALSILVTVGAGCGNDGGDIEGASRADVSSSSVPATTATSSGSVCDDFRVVLRWWNIDAPDERQFPSIESALRSAATKLPEPVSQDALDQIPGSEVDFARSVGSQQRLVAYSERECGFSPFGE